MSIYLNIEVQNRDRASWGSSSGCFREVAVEEDLEILAFDPVSETYSRQHDLTEAEQAEALRLADLVFKGTHYTSAGFVFEKSHVSGR